MIYEFLHHAHKDDCKFDDPRSFFKPLRNNNQSNHANHCNNNNNNNIYNRKTQNKHCMLSIRSVKPRTNPKLVYWKMRWVTLSLCCCCCFKKKNTIVTSRCPISEFSETQSSPEVDFFWSRSIGRLSEMSRLLGSTRVDKERPWFTQPHTDPFKRRS